MIGIALYEKKLSLEDHLVDFIKDELSEEDYKRLYPIQIKNLLTMSSGFGKSLLMYDERVKAQALEATWPILISYKNVPTYFVVLKNDVQSQKVVLINADNGSFVSIEDNITNAINSYDKLLFNNNSIEKEELTHTATTIRIRDLGERIEFTVNDINDYYFVVDVNVSIDARFLKEQELIEIKYKDYGTYGVVTYLKKL